MTESQRLQLTYSQLAILREQGVIAKDEIAFIAGDMLIAENPVTKRRRNAGDASLITESSNKRVLKG